LGIQKFQLFGGALENSQRLRMNINNIFRSSKTIFPLSILALSLVMFGILDASVNAEHPPENDSVITTFVPGFNQIAIRDSFNTAKQTDADGNSISTVTLDTSNGANGIVTINVSNAPIGPSSTAFA